MYFDSAKNRILLKNGNSIISEQDMIVKLLNGTEQSYNVESSDESLSYDMYFNSSISSEIVDVDVCPQEDMSTESDIEQITIILKNSRRYDASIKANQRFEAELSFFIKTGNLVFLKKMYELVQRFKKENVVWGVGRGSSCASYLLYLLEIHDIDPIKYDIEFSEFSKERIDKWE